MIKESTVQKYIGLQSGSLTVVSFSHQDEWKNPFFHCACSCGRKTISKIVGNPDRWPKGCLSCVNKGNTRRRLGLGEAAFNGLLGMYRNNAKAHGRCFGLTPDQFRRLTKQDCHYCGRPPSRVTKSTKGHGTYTYSGIDRVDNSKGYTPENTVPSCRLCNVVKGSITKEMVKKIHNHIYGA